MKKAGFTLVEILIYFALIGIVMTFFVSTVFQVIDSSDSLNKKTIREEEANFILRKIQWALTGVNTISVLNPQTLIVTKYNYGISPTPITIDHSGTDIRITKGLGASAVPLNSSNTQVTSLSFQHIAPVTIPPTPPAVRTTITINGQTYTMLVHKKGT